MDDFDDLSDTIDDFNESGAGRKGLVLAIKIALGVLAIVILSAAVIGFASGEISVLWHKTFDAQNQSIQFNQTHCSPGALDSKATELTAKWNKILDDENILQDPTVTDQSYRATIQLQEKTTAQEIYDGLNMAQCTRDQLVAANYFTWLNSFYKLFPQRPK